MTDYRTLNNELASLIHDVPHMIENLANASALLFERLEQINWAGFYLREGEKLILGPFQGKPACIEISMGKGVCGTAAIRDCTLKIDNVHEFPGHIACDSASNSEIVVPLHSRGCVVGVLDIDSPVLNRFSETDQKGLEAFAEILEKEVLEQRLPAGDST